MVDADDYKVQNKFNREVREEWESIKIERETESPLIKIINSIITRSTPSLWFGN